MSEWRKLANELRDAMMRLPELPLTPDWQEKCCKCELRELLDVICGGKKVDEIDKVTKINP
jgi:hypothetical protein